jgi:hypothetical protein
MEEEIEKQKMQTPVPLTYCILAGATILHALILTLMIRLNLNIISGRTWIVLVWFWFLWPIVISIHPARSLRRWLFPVVTGILLLVPCWFEILVFTSWRIDGFAP